MKGIFQNIRMSAIILACACIVLSFITCIVQLISNNSNLIISGSLSIWDKLSYNMFPLINFLSQTCQAFILIILACLIDPAKIVPIFKNEPKDNIIDE